MKVETIAPGLAARCSGAALDSSLDAATWERIEEAWRRHYCLVFPEQQALSIEAHVALLARFGPVLEERLPGDKHCYVTNALGLGTDDMNDGYRFGELTPHMDFTYTRYPADVISLYADELPEARTHTFFYSNVAPLARMPAELRARISGYSIRCAHDLAAMKPDARLYREGRAPKGAPVQHHDWPLVREHPHRPGVELLYCSMQQTERVLELSNAQSGDRESAELLSLLFDEYLYTEENTYEHAWQAGDLVIWDNVALQHARRAIPRDAGNRVLRRVSVCAAGNGIHETVAFLEARGAADLFA